MLSRTINQPLISADEVFAGLDKITSPSVTFKTTLDKGKKKTYHVTAVDQDGLESGYSPEIVVTGE